MKKIVSFIGTIAMTLLVSVGAFAEEAAAVAHNVAATATAAVSNNAYYAIAAAIAITFAAGLGAIGQSKAAAAALEGIARNPGAAGKVQPPMIIALALIESLVIYALVIAFLLQANIK